ncbi:MAG TPA: ABC transporter substrate-binding protein [Polyangia bacterium]|nr:ABC transporter substrate-binding protein [Polyangia bacterium]
MSKIDTLWYTRCPVPTPLGIASQLGWIEEEFKPDGIPVRTLQDETDPSLRESHFDHKLDNSFRQGGNIPAIWARSAGRETRVVGLTWTDEAQVILTRPGTGIRSVKDLAGRKLAVATRPADKIDFWKATTIRAYVAALDLQGLSVKDVELVELPRTGASSVGPRTGEALEPIENSAEAQALLRGEVDVIFHKGSRGLELADAIGAEIVFDVGAHPDPKVRVNNGSPRTLTVDAGLIEKDLSLVVRLVKRVLLAGRWAEEHPQEAVAYVARETRSSEEAVRRAYGNDVNQHLRTDLEESSILALADFTEFLHAWKFIPNAVDVRAWIDPRPLGLARAELAAEARGTAARPERRGKTAAQPRV